MYLTSKAAWEVILGLSHSTDRDFNEVTVTVTNKLEKSKKWKILMTCCFDFFRNTQFWHFNFCRPNTSIKDNSRVLRLHGLMRSPAFIYHFHFLFVLPQNCELDCYIIIIHETFPFYKAPLKTNWVFFSSPKTLLPACLIKWKGPIPFKQSLNHFLIMEIQTLNKPHSCVESDLSVKMTWRPENWISKA